MERKSKIQNFKVGQAHPYCSKIVEETSYPPKFTSDDLVDRSIKISNTLYCVYSLRVRAVFHKTVRVSHVYCNFKLSFTCRITVIFGTLKDGSLFINILASNICFSYRNMFQNGVDALSKIVDAFLSKSSNFYLVRNIRKCSNFASLLHRHLLRNYK